MQETSSKEGRARPARTREFERVDLVAEVTEWIRQAVFSGDFQVDASLPSEGDLAQELGVSRNVVREAMRNLRTMGLVEISQGRRPRVKSPAPEATMKSLRYLLHAKENSLDNLMEVRIPLESEIARAVAERAEDSDLDALEKAIRALEESRNEKERREADISFHGTLARSTRNPVFPLILDTVTGLLHGFHEIKVFSKSCVEVTVREHRTILEAIRRRDGAGAHKAMREHLEEGLRRSLATLK